MKLGSTYFKVYDSWIRCLLANQAPTSHILAFLVIVRCKYGANNYGASYTSLRNRLSIGANSAKALLDDLQRMEFEGVKLLTKFDHSGPFNTEQENLCEIDNLKKLRRLERWTIPVGWDNALFDCTLLDGNEKYIQKLIQHNDDEAIRLLLLLHLNNDISLDCVKPQSLCADYHMEHLFNEIWTAFWSATNTKELVIQKAYARWLYNLDETKADAEFHKPRIEKLLARLESYGLIQKVVMVLIYDFEEDREPSSFYEIDIKTTNYAEKHKNHSLATKIRTVARAKGGDCGRKDNRFYDDYIVAVPEGKAVWVGGVYRLKYGMRTMSNRIVAEGASIRTSTIERLSAALDNIQKVELCS